MSSRFDEALTLVVNEFEGLDGDRRYRNAFARVPKPDPLERVVMLGTDQRDLFVPLSTIAELAEVEGTGKFAAARDLLRDSPEAVDLRIEDDGPRKGMWSVAQPQYLAILRRAGL